MGKIIEDFLSVRSAITLGAFFTIYILVWTGRPVPDVIVRIVDLLLGYWFGSKVAGLVKTEAEQKEKAK